MSKTKQVSNNNKGKTNWNELEIGALWIKEDDEGKMRGEITINGVSQRVHVFKNTYKKEGEKTPDYRVYKDNFVPDPDFYNKNPDSKGKKIIPAANSYVDPEEVEDIPF